VPVNELVKGIFTELPEHIVENAGVAVAMGNGFTFMIALTGNPIQESNVGVIV
jgi:hypothetical protein